MLDIFFMECNLRHMLTLKDYYNSLSGERRRQVSEAAGTTVDYLYQVCRGQRRCSPELAKRLEKATGIPKYRWRPDIWEAA